MTGPPKKLLHTLPYIGKEYYISFDFKPTAPITTGLEWIIHFQKSGTVWKSPAYRYPAVFKAKGPKFYVATYIDDADFLPEISVDTDLWRTNQWTGIEISQQAKYLYF